MASRESIGIAELYHQLQQNGIRLQRELEAYYLRQEDYIRKRVAILDEMQENIADERRCLEIQHQDCRSQISAARKQVSGLLAEEKKVALAVQNAKPSLAVQEAEIDERLAELEEQKGIEDAALLKALSRQEELRKEEARLASSERQKFFEEQELQSALTEMRSMNREMEERRKSLQRKHETVAEWDRKLESRERDLAHCQDQLHVNLKSIEKEEEILGIYPAQRTAVVPAVSQRMVMDDDDMSICHENVREEIDYEDE